MVLQTDASFFHPVKLFEYRMVPLFMVLTKTADDVARIGDDARTENPWEKNVYRRKQVLYERLHLFFAYARVDRILYRREICLRVEI